MLVLEELVISSAFGTPKADAWNSGVRERVLLRRDSVVGMRV